MGKIRSDYMFCVIDSLLGGNYVMYKKKKKTNSTFQLMGYVSPCLSNMLFAYMIIGNVHVNDTR